MAILREEMMQKLQSGKCSVFFKKKNGEIRQMVCTLNPEIEPKILQVKGGASPPESVIPVWDIEKMQWRSFRVDSVLQFDDIEETINP